jgi:hypothetical protein
MPCSRISIECIPEGAGLSGEAAGNTSRDPDLIVADSWFSALVHRALWSAVAQG